MSSIETIRNLGPATAREFERAGITTAEELREIGGDAAYARLLASGVRPHFIGYYALHMGLQGRPWNDCRGEEKESLRKSFDALVANNNPIVPTGIEAELDKIGSGQVR